MGAQNSAQLERPLTKQERKRQAKLEAERQREEYEKKEGLMKEREGAGRGSHGEGERLFPGSSGGRQGQCTLPYPTRSHKCSSAP